jgi:acetyltransferase-like isoleucine patch superfamily enzyme
MHIGKQTKLSSLSALWPHKVAIGKNCLLQRNIVFTFYGPYSEGRSIEIKDNVFIGKDCEFNINCSIIINSYSNVSSGCKFIDHDHGIKLNELIGPQPAVKKEIIIEEDVWLGVNVVVLKGVTIGRGAVVGAGAVVTRSIPSNEIWGGIPAKKIGVRTI